MTSIENTPTTLPPPARFSWSPSKLNCFETCPNKYAGEFVYRIIPRKESVATIWGNRVHKTAEQHFLGQEITDLEAYDVVKDYCTLLERAPGAKLVEFAVGYTPDWRAIEGWKEAEGRMRVDLVIPSVTTGKMLILDWKTGNNIKDDFTQLKVNAVALADLYPGMHEFDLKYVWLSHKKISTLKASREDLASVKEDIMERVARMKEAHESENFPMRKNGLCKDWCGHPRCPHSGARR